MQVESVVQQLHDQISGMAHHWAKGREHDVEDFAQEGTVALLQVCRRYHDRPMQEIVKLGMRAVRNRMIDCVRRATYRNTEQFPDPELEEESLDPALETPCVAVSTVISRELYVLLRQGINTMARRVLVESISPAPARSKLECKQVRDCDIARNLKVSRATVCKARARIHAQARALGWCPSDEETSPAEL